MRMRRSALLTSLLLFALAAPAAHASTATVEAGALRVTGGAGEYNAVGIATVPAGLTVTDDGAPLESVSLDGGDGDDILSGGGGADVIAGDAGNDALAGSDGDDRIDGGTGADSAD